MENKDTQMNNLKEEILLKIRSGEVKMRPRAFFFAKVAILIFVAFIIFVVSVLLLSYVWFSIRVGGHLALLNFGGRGIFEFILVFPWFILLLDVLLILFLDWLLKRFRIGYHNPVLYVFLGSLVIITIFGTVLNMTSFHKSVMNMAENKNLPIPGVGGFYTELKKTHKEYGIYKGEVVSVATSSFIIIDGGVEGGNIVIFAPDGFDVGVMVAVGDSVYVAGDIKNDGKIRAYGIKKLTPNN